MLLLMRSDVKVLVTFSKLTTLNMCVFQVPHVRYVTET